MLFFMRKFRTIHSFGCAQPWLSMSLLPAVLLMVSVFNRADAQIMSADTSRILDDKKVTLQPMLKEEIPSKWPTGAMIRSAVFPGWGQLYTRHYIKSGIFFCLESGLVLSALMEDKKAQDAYATNYVEYIDRIDRRNQYIWWTVGVVVYSMIDAYVDAHLFNFDEDNVRIGVEPSNEWNEVRLSLSISIPDFK